LEEHLFQPEVEPVQENLISLANHVAFGAHGECFS
jgi:hypothetical protein